MMFSRMLQRMRPPDVEEAKRTEVRLAGRDAELNNDQFIERHLMQLQYSMLQYEDVAAKIDSSANSLKLVAGFGAKLVKSYDAHKTYYNTLRALHVTSAEFPGSLLDGMSSFDHYNGFLQAQSQEMTTITKKKFADPMHQLMAAHSVHWSEMNGSYVQAKKRLNQEKLSTQQRETQLQSALRSEKNARVRCERFAQRHNNVTAEDSEPSDNDETMTFEMIHNHWQNTILQCRQLRDIRDKANERLKVKEAQFRDLVSKLSVEAQVAEQHRVDAIKIHLKQLLEAELSQIEQRKSVLVATLLKVNAIDSVFDTRFFLHIKIIERFLAGECDTVRASPPTLDPLLPSRSSSLSVGSAASEIDTAEGTTNSFNVMDTSTTKSMLDSYLDWVFDTVAVTDEDPPCTVGMICSMLEFPHNREHVLQALNVFRSSKTHIDQGFDELVVLVVALLDSCYVHRDVKVGKMTSIMTETFFHELEDGTREYLQDKVKTHAIWQSTFFWQEAFLFSVREEVEKNMTRQPLNLSVLLSKLKQQIAKRETLYLATRESLENKTSYELTDTTSTELEALHTYQQIVFCQIGSYSFNMLSFDIEVKRVKEFVRSMSSVNCLKPEQTSILIDNVQSRSSTK